MQDLLRTPPQQVVAVGHPAEFAVAAQGHLRHAVLVVPGEMLLHAVARGAAPRQAAKAVILPARPLQPLQQVVPHHLPRCIGAVARRVVVEALLLLRAQPARHLPFGIVAKALLRKRRFAVGADAVNQRLLRHLVKPVPLIAAFQHRAAPHHNAPDAVIARLQAQLALAAHDLAVQRVALISRHFLVLPGVLQVELQQVPAAVTQEIQRPTIGAAALAKVAQRIILILPQAAVVFLAQQVAERVAGKV